MIVVRLAREGEARKSFIEILRIVDDEIVTLGLTGEESIDGFGSQPFFVDGFTFHPVEAGIEFGFEFVPFSTMSILGSPRKAIEFVDVEMR